MREKIKSPHRENRITYRWGLWHIGKSNQGVSFTLGDLRGYSKNESLTDVLGKREKKLSTG